MCGRFTMTKKDTDELTERFQALIKEGTSGTGRYNVAPTQEVLTVVRERDAEEPESKLLRWGLVPSWAKDLKKAPTPINAKAETAGEKPMFKGLVARGSHRCLVLADGFYEWLRPEDPTQPRQPFWHTVDGGEPFAFAGIWTRANIEGEEIESCAILTTEPNAVAAQIHNRMPVILSGRDAEAAWLDPGTDLDSALALCGPFPADRMEARPVSLKVNKVGPGHEGPELLQPPDGPDAGPDA